jgi:uncharacterized protein (DUF433 family)
LLVKHELRTNSAHGSADIHLAARFPAGALDITLREDRVQVVDAADVGAVGRWGATDRVPPLRLTMAAHTLGDGRPIDGQVRIGASSMVMRETRYEHIVLDDRGVPHIAGTTMKIVELVLSHLAYGWSPEELAYQYPHLSLGQIHSALAYYWDHQQAIDGQIAQDLAYVEEMRRATPTPPIVHKIRALRQN